MKEQDEKTYKKELLKISTNERRLDVLLSGRSKYRKTGEPLPFEGISVIHNINSDSANALQLPKLIEELKFGLNTARLDTKIAFVSTDSLHITTFDLINRGDHGDELRDKYQPVRNSVEQATIHFLKHRRLWANVSITGVGMFPPNVLKLNIEMNENDKERFKRFRLKLNKYLNKNVSDGYPSIRGLKWEGKHSHHITLGYIIKPLTEQEIGQFLDVLRQFQTGFTPISLKLTKGEVTAFTDMDHYSVVPTSTAVKPVRKATLP